jgi:hypothetical protein
MTSRVSLVLVDTESYVLANNALQQCVRSFDFDDVVIMSDRPELWPDWRAIRIPRIETVDDYNRLIISEVPAKIRTDFFIVAQYDGFIINPQAFRQEFYRFDFIGAPWPDYPYFRVGNGGFSWRSRKLAEAVAAMADFRVDDEPEDVFIGRILRVALETRYGCCFADEETAARFSLEQMPSGETSFGFHGLMHLPLIYRDDLPYLVEHLPERVLKQRLGLLTHGVNTLDQERQDIFWHCVSQRQHG